MLGDSNIIYIFDTQHLNTICFISHFKIISFYYYYLHYNIWAIDLISLKRTSGPSRCLFFVIVNTFVVLTTDKSRLFTVVIWLYCILCQQYGKCCVFLMYPHKGKPNSLVFIILLFCLSHWKIFRTKQGDYFYSPKLC